MTRKLGFGGALLGMLLFASAGAQGMMAPEHQEEPMHERGGAMMHEALSELDFLRHMIEHHQEAVDSARQLLEITERAQMRQLARDIIAEQEREIELMRRWLEQWYPDEPHEVDYRPMMRDLADLTADEADLAFLEDMIVHHQMAVMQAQQLLMQGLTEREEVAALARDIVAEQHREMRQMQSWLQEWFGVDAQVSPMATEMMPDMDTMDPGMIPRRTTRQGMMRPMMPDVMRPQMMRHFAEMMQMMRMHRMMQLCPHMMDPGWHRHMMYPEGMRESDDMPMPGMMRPAHPMMEDFGPYRFDRQAVEALARAFLAGYAPEAEIVEVQAPALVYSVTFHDGDIERSLTVDAMTGEVTLEED